MIKIATFFQAIFVTDKNARRLRTFAICNTTREISNVKCPQEYFKFIMAFLMQRKMIMEISDVTYIKTEQAKEISISMFRNTQIVMQIAGVVLE